MQLLQSVYPSYVLQAMTVTGLPISRPVSLSEFMRTQAKLQVLQTYFSTDLPRQRHGHAMPYLAIPSNSGDTDITPVSPPFWLPSAR